MDKCIYRKSVIKVVLALLIIQTLVVPCLNIPVHAAGMTLGITSSKTGNIFTSADTLQFTLTFTNTDSTVRTMNCTWNAVDKNNTVVQSGGFQQAVGANSSANYYLTPSVATKGAFTLTVNAVSTDSVINITRTAYFSRVLPVISNRGSGPFGICTHIAQGTYDTNKSLTLGGLLGAQFMRDEMYWSAAETTKGVVNILPAWDNYVDTAIANGMEPLIVLSYGNQFYDNGKNPVSTEGVNAFVNYAKTIVSHFAGKVKYFEVWNEWNLNGHPTFNPDSLPAYVYANLIKAVYPAVKQANPNAQVIGGVMCWPDDQWLKQVFDTGAFSFMDIISYHYYTYKRTPEEYGMVNDLKRINNLINSYGASKPIWISEFGHSAFTGSTGVTDGDAAAKLVRSYTLGLASGLAQKLFYYDEINDGTNPAEEQDGYGLVRNWSDPVTPYAAKQSFTAYNTLTHELVGATFVADLSTGNNLYIHKYHRNSDNKDVLVAWSLDGDRLQLNVGSANVTVTDIDGNSGTVTPVNNTITLMLKDTPQYIEGTLPSVQVVSRGGKTTLGSTQVSNGLTAAAGDVGTAPVVTLGGKQAWKITASNPSTTPYCILGNVDNAYVNGGTNSMEVTVEYYDQGTGTFTLQYDSVNDAFKEAETVKLTNTNTWKTYSFILNDARFSNQCNGNDFRVEVWAPNMGSSPSDVSIASISARKFKAASAFFSGSTPVLDKITSVAGSDGAVQQVTLGGKNAWKTNLSGTYGIFVNVDDNYIWNSVAKTVEVTVEYYDEANGKFTLQYDSTTNHTKEAEAVYLTGTNKWKTHTFVLNDALFNNAFNGNDFRIQVWGPTLGTSSINVGFSRVSVRLADGVSTTFGSTPVNNGITPQAGDSGSAAVVTLGGRSAWTLTTTNPYCVYGNISDTFINGGTNAVEVTVQYFDQGTGKFTLVYDSTTNAFKEAEVVNLTNAGTWKAYTFVLSDARFSNQCNANDFRLTLWAPNMGTSSSNISFSDISIVKKVR